MLEYIGSISYAKMIFHYAIYRLTVKVTILSVSSVVSNFIDANNTDRMARIQCSRSFERTLRRICTGKGNLSRKKKKERKRNQNKSSLTGSIDRRCKTSHFTSDIFSVKSYKRNRDRKEKRGRGRERIIRKSCLFLIACHFSVSSYRFFCHLHLYLLLVSPVCLRFPIGRVYVCAINVYINRK